MSNVSDWDMHAWGHTCTISIVQMQHSTIHTTGFQISNLYLICPLHVYYAPIHSYWPSCMLHPCMCVTAVHSKHTYCNYLVLRSGDTRLYQYSISSYQ
jgi:hypothetical protein